MGSLCLFTRQRALNYWLHDKNANHLDTELSLGYTKDLFDIRSIA